MSCIRVSGDEAGWRAAQDAPPLPFSAIPRRASKVRRAELMAQDSRPEIRAAAASSPDASPRLLGRLSRDPSRLVRSWVVRNPNAGRLAVWRLARDSDPGIAAYARFRRRNSFLFSLYRAIISKIG